MDFVPSTSELEHLKLIDSLADSFEVDWRSNRRPKIEDWIDKVPSSLRAKLVEELIAIELEIRTRRDETLGIEEYIRRFPGLHDAVRSAFSQFERSAIPPGTLDLEVRPHSRTQPDEDLPRAFGKYRIEERLGQGGFGAVYLATDLQLGRRVALKRPHPGSSPLARRRFLAEARSAAKLNHPGIVTVHECGEIAGMLYIASELIDGDELGVARRKRKPSLKRTIRWIRDAARALHYANQQGVVHRDVKPGNILVSIDDRVVITDFGLARRFDDPSSLTIDGQPFGTPAYMSPEQADGQFSRVNEASDQYSLGAVLYEVLTGRWPFRGTIPEILRQVTSRDDEPPSPRSVHAAVPIELESICLKAISYDAEDRYSSLVEMAADLDRWLRGEPVIARPVSRWQRAWKRIRRHPRISALVGLVLVLASGGGIAGLIAWKERSRADHAEIVVANQVGELHQTSSELKQSRRELTQLSDELTTTASESERRMYGNLIRQIETALREGGTPGELLREILERCPPALRNWEWNYFQSLLLSRPKSVFRNSNSEDYARWYASTLSNDGDVLYLVNHLGGVSVASLDSQRGSRLQTTDWGSGATRAPNVAVSSNGWVAVGSPSEGVVVRDRNFLQGRAPRFNQREEQDQRSFRLQNDDFQYGSPTARLKFDSPEVETFVVSALRLAESRRRPDDRLYREDSQSPISRSLESAIEFFKHLAPEALDRVVSAVPYNLIRLPRLSTVGWLLEFDPSDQYLAVGGDRFVQIWNLETRERVRLLPAHIDSTVTSLKFSPDGRQLACGMHNGELIFWDFPEGRERLRTNRTDPLFGLVWSNDSTRVALGLGGGKFGSIDIETGQVTEAATSHPGKVTAVARNIDGTLIASVGEGREIHLRRFADLATIAVLPAHHEDVPRSLAFRANNDLVVTFEREIQIRNFQTILENRVGWIAPEVVESRFDRSDSIIRCAISPDSRAIALSLRGTRWTKQTLRVRSLLTGDTIHAQSVAEPDIVGNPGSLLHQEIAFDARGTRFLVAEPDHLRYWSLPDWEERTVPRLPDDGQQQLNQIKVPDALKANAMNFPQGGFFPPPVPRPQRQPLKPLTHFADETPYQLAVDSSGGMLAVSTHAGALLLDSRTFAPRTLCPLEEIQQGRKFPTSLQITRIAFSSSGEQIAVTTNHGLTGVYSTADGGIQHRIDLRNPAQPDESIEIHDVAFHPFESMLAIASERSEITLWNTNTGEHMSDLVGHGAEVRCLAFHPNGSRLVSGSADDTIRLWNLHDQSDMLTLLSEPGNTRITSLVFTPDGTSLIAINQGFLRLFRGD